MSSLGQRVGRVFGIQPNTAIRYEHQRDVDHGTYIEVEPTTKEFLRGIHPTGAGVRSYFHSLFPFLHWLPYYNLQWLFGDFIAGVTVGFVVVPQGMAYALLANLPPEYGLYTSFVGFLLYWAFATSKDITIGAVAVMSTIVGNVITEVRTGHPEFAPDEIARALALIVGIVLLGLGILRLGFVVEVISITAIASFMTGAAISIGVGQVPALLGLTGVNTRDPSYLVIINSLKALPTAKLDAAMGLTCLFFLYFVRSFCNYMSERQPQRKKMWFFISTLRMAVAIIIYILVSFLVNRGIAKSSDAKFKILGTVPSGFQHAGAPKISTGLLNALAPHIPTSLLVLIIEHISISKSFGRINNYIIDPSQELIAIGFSNIFGPFLGGFPATGSFSRTAIKSKAGVRTPLAGLFTAVIVLLALYALTSVFFYIPSASLAAIIIHAVGDLITPPKDVYQFWKTSPVEVFIFFAGVIVAVFTALEPGIYVTVGATAALLLFRTAKSSGRFLGRVQIFETPRLNATGATGNQLLEGTEGREAYITNDHADASNIELALQSPYPGVFIYRFTDGFNYLNSARHLDILTINIFNRTRKTELDKFEKKGDRPWNAPEVQSSEEIAQRPVLRAVILDFSAVSYLDTTSAQALIDLRNQFNRYAAPQKVEWHFAGVTNRWTKRALVASGFGYDTPETLESDKAGSAGPLVTIADAEAGLIDNRLTTPTDAKGADLQGDITPVIPIGSAVSSRRLVPVYGVNRPFLHIDIPTAVHSVVYNIEHRGIESN
ncbi:sulfate permease [Thozetella sp. PMI_491]|nr:sulfate permease [Thozetella sp. PMI_491]